MSDNEWLNPERAQGYLNRADRIPHRTEGEAVLQEAVPLHVRRVLDLGAGNGRTLALLLQQRATAEGIALDFSPAMLDAARTRFAAHPGVQVVDHDLDHPLPPLGTFDAVVSTLAIHHLAHERKRSLYAEIFTLLQPGGVFCNLDHVASPTPALHQAYLRSAGLEPKQEDPANQLLGLDTQLAWLRDLGYTDVDCLWKWREYALFVGTRPPHDH
jgi:tRNA (cmo5U34)-methyltransferase